MFPQLKNRRILDRRQKDGISSHDEDARMVCCDRRKYLQVCISYYEGGKDASSIHGVPLALRAFPTFPASREADVVINLWNAELGVREWLRSGVF